MDKIMFINETMTPVNPDLKLPIDQFMAVKDSLFWTAYEFGIFMLVVGLVFGFIFGYGYYRKHRNEIIEDEDGETE